MSRFRRLCRRVRRSLFPDFLTPSEPFLPLSEDSWPIVEHTLKNGLKVRLIEDHSVPGCAMQTFFAVGSRDEVQGRTGISHFLEHMMFNGTPRVGAGLFDKILELSGGESNAFTTRDVTAYENLFPRSALPCVLRLESDRMRGLALDEALIASERDVVLEEWRASSVESIEGRLSDALYETAFRNHPYRIPVIGFGEDIQKLTADSCREHFGAHYAPNFATLWLSGDIDADRTIELIEQLYGDIPPSGKKRFIPEDEPRQSAPRICRVRFPAHSEALAVGYRTSAARSPDAPLLNLIANLLTGRSAARLTREFVYEREIAVGAMADFGWHEMPGLFTIQLDLFDGQSAEDALAELDKFLSDIAANGFSDEEIAIALSDSRAALLKTLSTCQGRCDYLGMCEAYTGDWRTAFEDDRQLAKATPEDIRQTAARLFDKNSQSAVLLSCGSREGGNAPEVPDESEADGVGFADGMDGSDSEACADALHENSGSPASGSGASGASEFPFGFEPPQKSDFSAKLSLPAFIERTLPNGLRLAAARHGKVPLVSLHLAFRMGSACDPMGKEGLTALTMALLKRGTEALSAEQLDDALSLMGATMTCSAGEEVSTLSATSPASALLPLSELISHIVQSSAFSDAEIAREKERLAQSLALTLDDPASVADFALARALFDGHPFGRPAVGTPDSLRSIGRADVLSMARRILSPERAILTIAGDLDPVRALSVLESIFGAWASTGERDAVIDVLPPEAPRALIVHIPEATQARLRVANRVPGLLYPGRRALCLAAHALGGGFTSRLIAKVRVEQGLTYGISALVSGNSTTGAFSVQSFTKNATIRALLDSILSETRRFSEEGFMPGELDCAKMSLCGAMPFSFETAFQLAGAYSTVIQLDRPRAAFGTALERYMALTEERVVEAARSWLFTRPLAIAAAGDADAILRALSGFSGEVRVLQREELLK